MKLSISNIAWDATHDLEMFEFLHEVGFNGLEIAPTRIFLENPYDHLVEAKTFAEMLNEKYNLTIPSMQSIWFGKTEKVFGSEQERQFLIDYTKKAILFAEAIKCKNLVFGNPKNRNIETNGNVEEIAVSFFKEISDYAALHNTTIGLEPNPSIYNTNFINTTKEAFEFCRKVNSSGLKVNVDLGTMLFEESNVELLNENTELINHIHISEPYLKPIVHRELHKELLKLDNYHNFISIEMGNCNDIDIVKECISYIKEVFQ
ncbi:sugar phosphate isomerase/epimerase family protein [Anaerorhabdus sp.]|uniref:sugar phosphate isomerase/epimerase family protein n=1 Tax=Anaerorhabdus sp. TaxID=1872524 RepID=UPI002FCA891A